MKTELSLESRKKINELSVILLGYKKQISDIRNKQRALMKDIQTKPRADTPKNRAQLHAYGREVLAIEREIVALTIGDKKAWTPEEREIVETALAMGGWTWAEITMLRQVLEKL